MACHWRSGMKALKREKNNIYWLLELILQGSINNKASNKKIWMNRAT